MRRLLLSLLALLCCLGSAAAQSHDQAAIDAYRAADYRSARELWSEALEQVEPPLAGAERARVLYDLGNCSAREERWEEAVGWYTAALRLRPRDADTWSNLELARLKAGFGPADRGDLSSTLRLLCEALTAGESEWLALLGLLPLALALAGEALRGGRAWKLLVFVGVFVFLCSLAPLVWQRTSALDAPHIVIEKRGAGLLSEPRSAAKRLTTAQAGVVLESVDALPDWVKVVSPDGEAGWVPADEVFALSR